MASNDSTFVIAGTTVINGVKTFRFSNGKLNLRANMLRHKGHEDISLHELPRPMTQVKAIAWLLENVKGTRGAVIATRAADKTVKSDTVLAGEAMAAKRKLKAKEKAAVSSDEVVPTKRKLKEKVAA